MATRVISVFVFLLLSYSAAFAEDAQDEPSAESRKAIAALKEWRAALHSVSLTFEVTAPGGSKRAVDWDWYEDGSLRENAFIENDAEHLRSRKASLFTGGKMYSMEYADGESDYWKPESVKVSAPISGSSSVIVTPLFGLWFNHSCKWLPDEFDANSEWLETANGHSLTLVTPRLRLDLDPDHSFLPVAAQTVAGDWQNLVGEFQTVEPGIPFPKKGVFIQTFKVAVDGATRLEKPWEITAIRINDPGTAAKFKPPIPDGTEVLNALGEVLYVKGVGPQRDPVEYQFRPAPPPGPSVWNHTTEVLVALGVVLAIGGFSLLRRWGIASR